MVQRLYLSIDYAGEAVCSKERMESLAFAMLVKLTFVNSKIKDATVERCKKIFGIGSAKMCRIIRNGIGFGYLRRDGKEIVACKIRNSESYHFHNDFDLLTASRTAHERKEDDEVRCKYSLREMIGLIREAVLLNHISKQSDCADTIKSLQEPKTSKELKKAKKWQKRMRLSKDKSCELLSNRRIMDVINASLYHSRRTIRSIVGKRWALKRDFVMITDIKPGDFNRFSANRWFKENRIRGFFFKLYYEPVRDYVIACNASRMYRYDCNLISFER